MLEVVDPSLCQQVSSTRTWTLAISFLSSALARPLVVLTLFVTGAGFIWQLTPRVWKKRIILASAAIGASYLLILSPLGNAMGTRMLTAFVPPDSGKTADAIVVLGRGYEQNPTRAQVAGALWKAKRAPLIFISGRVDSTVMETLLSPAVPAAAIATEPCSLTTDQNAEFTAALLRPEGIKTIILVTDPLHMWRSLLTFQSFGFTVIPHYTPLSPDTQPSRARFLFAREAIGLFNYAILGRYRSREAPAPSVMYDDKLLTERSTLP
ncbi:MAG: YdcF family protein [Cyanobacteria bacterium P01_D01_bin.105]